MAAATLEETKISLKVLVNKEKNRLVCVEANSDFVDILFSFMTLPMGTIVRLLKKHSDETPVALGSLNNLYQSLIDLPEKYFGTEECKLMLLNPRNAAEEHCRRLKLNIDDSKPIKYFLCKRWDSMKECGTLELTTYKNAKCITCGGLMDQEIHRSFTVSTSGNGVFVDGMATFIVTDDLHVMPNSPGCIISLLKDLGITCMSHIEERTFDIGLNEILSLLKWAIFKSPLSCLLLPKHDSTQNLVFPEQDQSDQKLLSKLETATGSKKMTLKVNFQRSTSKFLFAITEEDFVDFVLGFLALPLGTVIGQLNATSSIGCMDNLYTSISNTTLQRYFKSQHVKDLLLQPKLAPQHLSKNQIFSLKEETLGQIYINELLTTSGYRAFWDTRGNALPFKDPRVNSGFVKEPTMFMVTDDLVITPLSSISSVNFLKKLGVALNDVEEHEATIGMEEALRILKASLTSPAALSNGLMLQLKKSNQKS